MSSVFVPALHFSAARLSDIMNACFQQYVVPLSVTPDYFAARFGAEGLSLSHSGVWMQGEDPVAIALVTRRSQRARIAAFAIAPQARGQGLAKPMMAQVLARLAQDGVEQVALEAIVGNTAAIALYQAQGFAITQTLPGFVAPDHLPRPAQPLTASSTDALLSRIWRAPQEDIPWLLDPLSFPALPCHVFSNGQAAWAVIDTLNGSPQLRYLFVEPAHRRQGLASELLRNIAAHYPGIRTPVSVPERFTALFGQAGYQPVALKQVEMRVRLPSLA